MTKAPSHPDQAQLLAELGQHIETLTSSDGWRRWIQTAARFRNYSLHNQLLILSQRPEATRVAGFRAWQALGRQVKRGERGIAIFAPVVRRITGDERDEPTKIVSGFRVVYVFDLAQTEGEPLAELTLPAVRLADADLLARLISAAEHAGFAVRTVPRADDRVRGWWEPQAHRITLVDDYDVGSQCRTLLHELGHAHDVVDPVDATPVTAERELVAESVAYLTGRGLGLDLVEASATYVASWGGRPELGAELAQRVLKVAADVEQVIGQVRAA